MERYPVGIFAHGTWKRGGRHHDAYCQGYRSVEEAYLWGRMFDVNWGFPLLELHSSLTYGTGTRDIRSDLEHAVRIFRDFGSAVSTECLPKNGGWIPGDFMIFEDPAERLQALDQLEGFRPEDPKCLFQRVLFPVQLTKTDQWRLAWVYSFHANRVTGLRKRRIILWQES